jgi:hypothetical protein
MKYDLRKTKVIHWDKEGLAKINAESDTILQVVITAELYQVNKERLPIIIEAQFKIIDNGVHISSAIFHTKAILTFEFDENPVNDLMKMFSEAFIQEKEQWEQIIIGTPLQGNIVVPEDVKHEARFNKAYEIMEHARKRNLLALPQAPPQTMV